MGNSVLNSALVELIALVIALGLSCPRDVALVVFDELPMADVLRPHLTTVAQPSYLMGYRGAELLIRRLSGQLETVNIGLRTELTIRESTGAGAGEPHGA
jgi:DNA-binding LacI/PurR family transcriptional regulator